MKNRPIYPPAPGESDERIRYPAACTMHPAIGKRYEGLDMDGRHVSGIIRHAGNYDKHGHPTTWVLIMDNPHERYTAIISTQVVQAHLEGLALFPLE